MLAAAVGRGGDRVTSRIDILDAMAPMLRVRPELQDFCRFGGGWRSAHAHEGEGWAAFHIVMRGSCQVDRPGEPTLRLEAGDVLLLPHGDGHVVYGGGGGPHELREIEVNWRDHIRFKRTAGDDVDTELVCGRLHLENAGENLLLRTLPAAIVQRLDGRHECAVLVAMLRGELERGDLGATAVAGDLASALFTMLLRRQLEAEPPVEGMLALLAARETGRAVAAMLGEPAREWSLDELASVAAVSRATLTRAFRRIGGLPPQAFLTEVRLGIARMRIRHSSEPLARIAGEVGYQSEAALSRAFQRRFNTRPGAMRRCA